MLLQKSIRFRVFPFCCWIMDAILFYSFFLFLLSLIVIMKYKKSSNNIKSDTVAMIRCVCCLGEGNKKERKGYKNILSFFHQSHHGLMI